MTSPTERRYRPIPDLEPLELLPLVGAGASLEQLRRTAENLRNGFALECLVEGRWGVVGYSGTEEAARDWAENGGEPTCAPDM